MLNDTKIIKHEKVAPVLVEDVAFFRGERPILRQINLKVQQGEFLGIVGPNGAGKTTLLRLILGLEKPQFGRILLLGKPLRDLGQDRRLIGYLPQKPLVDPYFPVSVFDVIQMGLAAKPRFFTLRGSGNTASVEKVIRRLNLTHLSHRPIGELSGGQQQLVFLARSLVNQPELLLVDEPTTGLDADTQQLFYRLMRELRVDFGLTIIVISHDLDRMAHYADRLVCLNVNLLEPDEFTSSRC